MISKLHLQTMKVLFASFVIALLLQLSLVTVSQASTRPIVEQKDPDCRIKVMAGWRPYRVQASDNLGSLADRADVTVDMLMQINCLTTTEIAAGDLVLVPALRAASLPVQNAEPEAMSASVAEVAAVIAEPEAMTASIAEVAAAVEEGAPAISVAQLLTMISTTTDLTEGMALTESLALTDALASLSTGGSANVNPPGPPSAPFTSSNVVLFSLFVMGALGMLFFALRPRQGDSPVIYKLFSLFGNALFLFAGVLIGAMLFPALQAATFTSLPTGVSVALAIVLIGLLAVKELFFSGQQWRTASRLLNFGIVPLLMLFFLTVATKVAEIVN